jgi:hypothetical protein
MSAEVGSYALSGQAVTFGRTTLPEGNAWAPGSWYALSWVGTAWSQGGDRSIAAAQGSLALSGQDAALKYARLFAADRGTYALAGQDATFTRGQRKLVAETGALTLTGLPASFFRSNLVGQAWAENAWYSGAWYGTAWAADYSGLTNYRMTAASGEFDVVGIEAVLRFGYSLAAEQGSYAYTGDDALRDMLMRGEPGAYALAGQSAGVNKGRTMSAEAGTYTLSGQSANTLFGYYTFGNPGYYSLNGFDVVFGGGLGIACNTGSYALSGQDATFKSTYILGAETGQITLTGYDATFNAGQVMGGGVGYYALTGGTADLSRIYKLLAEPGYYNLGGQLEAAQEPRKQEAGGSKRKRQRKRVTVEIDGQLFTVNDEQEAEELIASIREVAEQQARAEADRVVKKRRTAARREKKPLKLTPIELPAPQVKSADRDFAAELQSRLDEIYADAARDAEIALRVRRQAELDEEDSIVLFLLSE